VPRFEPDPGWLCFDPDPSEPSWPVPAGAVDAHCHVFGPGETFPYAPERKYTPCDAPKETLFAVRDRLGFARNVIVQATCHGADNSAMLDALAAAGERARGVATVSTGVGDAQLAELDSAGVRAVRFNFVRRLADPAPEQDYRRVVERIAPLGWHVVVYFEAADLAERYDFLTSLPTPVVVDHLGRPDVSKSVDGPEFAPFLRLMSENEQFVCKVTGAERLSRLGPPGYDDFVPFARRVVDAFPDRVLWGTDWPHPNLTTHMPDDGALVDLVARIAPDEAARRRLLVDNPMRIYWSR